MSKFTDLPAEKQEDIVTGTAAASLSLLLLSGVIRNARKGRWEKALVYSVIWLGQAVNSNAVAAERKAARRHKEIHDCQHEMNKVFASAARRGPSPYPGTGPL